MAEKRKKNQDTTNPEAGGLVVTYPLDVLDEVPPPPPRKGGRLWRMDPGAAVKLAGDVARLGVAIASLARGGVTADEVRDTVRAIEILSRDVQAAVRKA